MFDEVPSLGHFMLEVLPAGNASERKEPTRLFEGSQGCVPGKISTCCWPMAAAQRHTYCSAGAAVFSQAARLCPSLHHQNAGHSQRSLASLQLQRKRDLAHQH